jgi:hypothetical protein
MNVSELLLSGARPPVRPAFPAAIAVPASDPVAVLETICRLPSIT